MRLIFAIFAAFCSIVAIVESEPNPSSFGGALSGYVLDSATKETLIGVPIYVPKLKTGTYTNKLGYYSLTGLPDGEFEIKVSYIGYKPKTFVVKIKNGRPIRKDVFLAPANVKTDEVIIEAEKDIDAKVLTVSKIDIPVEQLNEIRIGGEADVFRSMQLLPGVLTSSQISSGLYVRGGSPDQNLVLVDGTPVYNPSHLFGFISTFNSNAIKDVELIKGGYPAEYGGRLSAVLNVTQKDGNRDRVKGMASIGAIASKLNVEGPLFGGSFFIGGRRTYFDLIKKVLPEDPQAPLPDFGFYDLNAKIVQPIGEDDKVVLSGFASADDLYQKAYGLTMDLGISNRLASLRWTHIFSEDLFSSFIVSGSYYENKFKGDQSGYNFILNNSIRDYSIKGDLEWFVRKNITAKFGFEATDYVFSYLQDFSGDTSSTKADSSSVRTDILAKQKTYSVYGQANYNFSDLAIAQFGLRANYWTLADKFTLAPRLSFKYYLSVDVSFQAAWGIYYQNLRLGTQPDFSFFDTWTPTDESAPISSARHYVLSLETKPFREYLLNFDLYYKNMKGVSELNRSAFKGTKVADMFFFGDAESYGAEIFFQKKYGAFTGWIGYAIGAIWAKFPDINGGKRFHPKYDRTHDLKIVAQYKLSEKIEIGGSFVFQSGQSYTGATSRFQIKMPGDYWGRGKIVPSQRYGLRLPPSHQLNLNASYKFKFFGLDARAILDVYNVYNRRDIWFRYYDIRKDKATVEDVRLLPIIPTFSWEAKF